MKTFDKAGRQNLSTSREIPSGPLDFVVNCLKAQFKLSIVMLENLKGGQFEFIEIFFGLRKGSEFCVDKK